MRREIKQLTKNKMGKMRKLAETMREENWFNNEESSKLIDNAVKEGFVLRPSASQCEWTEKGLAFFKAETEGLYFISLGINTEGLLVAKSERFDVLKVNSKKIILDNEDLHSLWLYDTRDEKQYSNGIDTSEVLEPYVREFGLKVEVSGYFTDKSKGEEIVRNKLEKSINKSIENLEKNYKENREKLIKSRAVIANTINTPKKQS